MKRKSRIPNIGSTGKRTSNTEHRTPNIEWINPQLRVNEEAESSYARKNHQKYDLEDRLLNFAVEIIELTEALPNTRAANHVAGQLLRSGTSPYGNHGEVEAAESINDFIHKLKVCLKELRETRRWLRLVGRLKHQGPSQNLSWRLNEADELIRIFKASITTAEGKR